MPRPVHFELSSVEDTERAKTFYSDVFGWSFQKYGGAYWLTTTGPGINGGIRGRLPGQGAATINTVGVESVDATVATITAAGGQVIMPKMAVPSMGWVAYCLDTEGIVFGVFQEDSAAA